MSNSLKAQVWSLIAKYRNGTERVERVSHEEFGPFEFGSESFDPKNGGDVMELRVVEHFIDVPSDDTPTAGIDPDEPGWRVEIKTGDTDCDRVTSHRMTLRQAMQVIKQFDFGEGQWASLLPPGTLWRDANERPLAEQPEARELVGGGA